MDIADAGTTGHSVIPGPPVTDISSTTAPLLMNIPDGRTIQSKHTYKLATPWLPDEAKISQIVPGLVHSSLVSIKVICDAGFKVTY